MTSLNPYLRISEQLVEPLVIHDGVAPKAALPRAIEILEKVGIRDAAARVYSYPHEFSGGQRQRIGLARALGATGILVRTGRGAETERAAAVHWDHVVDDLPAGTQLIERLSPVLLA